MGPHFYPVLDLALVIHAVAADQQAGVTGKQVGGRPSLLATHTAKLSATDLEMARSAWLILAGVTLLAVVGTAIQAQSTQAAPVAHADDNEVTDVAAPAPPAGTGGNVVVDGLARFTALTDRTLRIEYNAAGQFSNSHR